MRANVTEGTRGAIAYGIGAQEGLLLARGFERSGKPILRVFDLNHAKFAKSAVANHLAGLAHHRITGVIVCQSENQAGSLDDLFEFERVGK